MKEEIRTNEQLLRTAIDCLTIIRKQVSKKIDLEKTWIWDGEELRALDTVLEALKDCV